MTAMIPRFFSVTSIAAALVLGAVGCGSDEEKAPAPEAAQPAADGPLTVPIREFKYVPPSVTVAKGSVVTFVNEDSAPHTATVTGGGFDTGTLQEGERGDVRVDKPGVLKYICELHPYMKGTIVVR